MELDLLLGVGEKSISDTLSVIHISTPQFFTILIIICKCYFFMLAYKVFKNYGLTYR